MTISLRIRRHVLFYVLVTAGAFSSGCYKHVVRVDGPAEETYEIHESNLEKSRVPIVDELIDAAEGDKNRSR